MAYLYDADRQTRGVGAIAAIDGSASRQRRGAQIVRAMRARDRVMAAVAGGALGAIRLPKGMTDETGSTYATTSPTPPLITMTAPPATTPTAYPTSQLPPGPQPVTVIPVTTTKQPGGGGSPVPGTPSGIVMGLPVESPVLYPQPVLMPEDPLPPQPDNTTRNALLLGAAALAAYLLLRRKRP